MGNVISGQQGLSDLQGEDSTFWNNGTIFGKEIERIIIKNNPVLQKRACCMGITDGQPNTGNGLEVPIANIGISDFGGYASKNNFDKKWNKTVNDNYVYKDDDGKVIENANPYEDEFVKTELGDTMMPTSDPKRLMYQGMTIKNLGFSKENVPSCSFEPTKDRFNETSKTGTQEYKGYPQDKDNRTAETETSRRTCDTFMEAYSKQSIIERQCITTCGEIRDIDQDELDTLGFGKVCRGKGGDKKILDVRKPGCRQGEELIRNIGESSSFHPAFNYPTESTCELSPYGDLYNSDAGKHLGKVFNSSAILRKKVNFVDSACFGREDYDEGVNAAYLKLDFLQNDMQCVNVADFNNVNINAGNSAKVNVRQESSCANTTTDSSKATPAVPTGQMNTADDAPTFNNPDSSPTSDSGSGGNSDSSSGNSDSSSGNSDSSSGGMKPPVLPPMNTKRKLGLPVDDEIAYGIASIVSLLVFM